MLGPRNLPRTLLLLLAIPACLSAQRPSDFQQLATATRRISGDGLAVVVYQGGKRVELPRFHELVIVKPLGPIESLDHLVQTRVILVPSDKRHGEWNVYAEPAGHAYLLMTVSQKAKLTSHQLGELTTVDNLYTVKGVIVSSSRNPVEVHAGKVVYKLEPGEALLVLR